MSQNFASPFVALQKQSMMKGNNLLPAILHLQKLNGCSVNNLKKYLASQHGIDCQALNATIKPIMKMAMDRNILKNLGDTGKMSECKKRKKSSGGGKKRRKSGGKKSKKSAGKGNKSGPKQLKRKSKKAPAAV